MFTLTASEEKRLHKRYGNLFYKAYKKDVMEAFDRREMIDKLLEKHNKRQNNDSTSKYGHLLDRYIR